MSMPEGERPLIKAGLPDWLANVPMKADKPVWIPIGEGKSVSLDLLLRSLQSEVGTTMGSMAIAPELRNLFAQWTENPSWNNLRTEPTSVERVNAETWIIEVGKFSRSFTKDQLAEHIKQHLQKPDNTSPHS